MFYRESEDNNSLPMVLSEPKEVAMKFRCICNGYSGGIGSAASARMTAIREISQVGIRS